MNRDQALLLAEEISSHLKVSHWAISQRIFGKGDFFHRLMNGSSCLSTSLERAHTWFHQNWPEDLKWPDEIPVPDKQVAEAVR